MLEESYVKTMVESEEVEDRFEDLEHSSSYVIHGNYTTTGKPIIASDPHSKGQIPAYYYVMDLHFNGTYVSGGSYPGLPFFNQGKTPSMSWVMSSSLSDQADVFKEEVSEDGTQYFVDG